MLTHKAIWRGIDMLAAKNQLSASGLAKRAGLDPTTFNKSKRTTKQGKPRWPSTESLSKILDATQTTMGEFVALLDDGAAANGEVLGPARRVLGGYRASHLLGIGPLRDRDRPRRGPAHAARGRRRRRLAREQRAPTR